LNWQFGLASLLDVQSYEAYRLASIGRNLTTIGLSTYNWDKDSEKSESECKRCLSRIIEEADFIGLSFTKKGAQRLLAEVEKWDKTATKESLGNFIAGRLDTLEERFYDELEEIRFFFVKSDRLSWFENTEAAGDQFKAKFPKANTELIEAGNCFALDRYTACVFHLTRALEIVLSSLHRALNIPDENDPRNNTWGRKLNRISEKIDSNDKTPPPGWSNDANFYKKVYALLEAVRTPLRDDTVHIATVYDETGALCVLLAMVGALNQVATKLSETNGGVVALLPN